MMNINIQLLGGRGGSSGRGGGGEFNPGLPPKVWKKLKNMAKENKMPASIVGDVDNQILVLTAINRLYPAAAEADIKDFKIQKTEINGRIIYRATVGNRMQTQSVPKGAENNKEARQGTLKMFIANLKKEKR